MPLRAKFFQSRFSADFRELDVVSNFIWGNVKACADGLGNVNCQCVATPRCEFHNYTHHHHARFELSLGCAVENLIDFLLNQLSDLLVSALLAYRAGNILDFEKVTLYCRSS